MKEKDTKDYIQHTSVETCNTAGEPVRWIRTAIALAILVLLATGCEEDVIRHNRTDAPFSVYGVLSPDLDSQSVRVYPVDHTPQHQLPSKLEVDVISTDLRTGAQKVWTKSVFVDRAGDPVHTFSSNFRPEYGHTYRIDVIRRSDDQTTSATVRIPPRVTVLVVDEDDPTLDVFVHGDGVSISTMQVVYNFYGKVVWAQYSGRGEKVDGGWRVQVDRMADYTSIGETYEILPFGYDDPFAVGAELYAIVGDDAWYPPGGVFDSNYLSFAETMSNVENGYGLIGSGYRIAELLNPSRSATEPVVSDDATE